MGQNEYELEDIMHTASNKIDVSPGEIIIGTLTSFSANGEPCVSFFDANKDIVAISTVGLSKSHIGRKVALLFSDGNINAPVIMGLIHNPLYEMLEKSSQQKQTTDNHHGENTKVLLNDEINTEDVLIDGNKITFNAKDIIVLKCGESSITLTKSGKILIRGNYLLNRSTGVNRIMGGSVQVN